MDALHAKVFKYLGEEKPVDLQSLANWFRVTEYATSTALSNLIDAGYLARSFHLRGFVYRRAYQRTLQKKKAQGRLFSEEP